MLLDRERSADRNIRKHDRKTRNRRAAAAAIYFDSI